MGMDPSVLKDQCSRTLAETNLRGFGERIVGKVRDNYVRDGVRTMVASAHQARFTDGIP